jgi:hypothetical protein
MMNQDDFDKITQPEHNSAAEKTLLAWKKSGIIRKFTPFKSTSEQKATSEPFRVANLTKKGTIPDQTDLKKPVRGGGRTILTTEDLTQKTEQDAYHIFDLSHSRVYVHQEWDWESVLNNYYLIALTISEEQAFANLTQEEEKNDYLIVFDTFQDFIDQYDIYDNATDPEEKRQLLNKLVLGSTVDTNALLTGSYRHMLMSYDLGGLSLATRFPDEDRKIPFMNEMMIPFQMVDIRELALNELKLLLDSYNDLIKFRRSFQNFKPNSFFKDALRNLLKMRIALEDFYKARQDYEGVDRDIHVNSRNDDLVDPLSPIYDPVESVVIPQEDGPPLVVKYSQRIPSDYEQILRNQLIAVQTIDLGKISPHRVNFFVKVSEKELDEIFDKNPKNLWCVRPIVLTDGTQFKGIDKILTWYERDLKTTAEFFYRNLQTFSKQGVQFYITVLCQCILKNVMKLYLTFNNRNFDRSYKYGSFSREDLLKSEDNFRLIKKFTRYNNGVFGSIESDISNFLSFKIKIFPQFDNMGVICQNYSEFRSDILRLQAVMDKIKRLRKDYGGSFEIQNFYINDYMTLTDLEAVVNQLYGKFFSKELRKIQLESELIDKKQGYENNNFMLQLGLLGLTIASQYF